jgi:hypothetical protein
VSQVIVSEAEQKRTMDFESSKSDLNRKYWIALALFGFLAVVAWITIGGGYVVVMGKPVEIRLIPLVVIGGLVLRTVLARQAERIRREDS